MSSPPPAGPFSRREHPAQAPRQAQFHDAQTPKPVSWGQIQGDGAAQSRDASEADFESFDEATQIQDQAQARPAVLPRGTLTVLVGEQEGHRWFLNREEQVLGRGRDVDFILYDLAASRRHLRFLRHQEGFRFEDLSSGNGSWLNGRRQSEGELYDGDELDIGESRLRFDTIGDPRSRDSAEEGDTNPDFKLRKSSPLRAHIETLIPQIEAIKLRLPQWPTSALPIKWLLGGAGVLSVVLGMMIAPTSPEQRDRGGEQGSTLPKSARGVALQLESYFQRGALIEARQLLSTTLSQLSAEEGAAMVKRLLREEQSKVDLEEASKQLAMGHFDAARRLLSQLPKDTFYGAPGRSEMLRFGLAERHRLRLPISYFEQGRLEAAAEALQTVDGKETPLLAALRRTVSVERKLLRGASLSAKDAQLLKTSIQLYQRGGLNESVQQLQRGLRGASSPQFTQLIQRRMQLIQQVHGAEYRSAQAWQQGRRGEALSQLSEARRYDRELAGGRGLYLQQVHQSYCVYLVAIESPERAQCSP